MNPSCKQNHEKRECPKRNGEVIYRFGEHGKGLMNKNQQSFVQQDLERLFPITRGRGRGSESRAFHGIGASESSASTATDTNTSFPTTSTKKSTISEIWGSKTCGDSR